jgi:hypothetical protein
MSTPSLPHHFDRAQQMRLVCLAMAAAPLFMLGGLSVGVAPQIGWPLTLGLLAFITIADYIALFFIVRNFAPQKGTITHNLITLEPFCLPYLGWSSKGGMYAVNDYRGLATARSVTSKRPVWSVNFLPKNNAPLIKLSFASEAEAKNYAEFFSRELNLPIENTP